MADKDPICVCDHAFSSHTKIVREAGSDMDIFIRSRATKPDFDIYSGEAAGESGCTECECRQWRPA
jgi:hypothetical protein